MQAEPIGAHPLLLEKELAALPRIDRITMNSHVSLSGLDSAFLSLETEQLGGAGNNAAAAKQHHTRLGISALGDWAESTSSGLLGIAAPFYSDRKLAGRNRPLHNLVISNVRGPGTPLYAAGARLAAAYPRGPNIGVVSCMEPVDSGASN